MFELVRAAIIFVGTGIGAFTDYKTGLIPDKITYPMVFLGILINLIELIFSGFGLEKVAGLYGIGAIVFVLGYVLYVTGKIGGGDIKLFTGIALLLPFSEGIFPLNIFILQVLFFSAVIAVSFLGIYYSIRYFGVGIDWKENRDGVIRAVLFGMLFAVYFFLLHSLNGIPLYRMSFLAVAVFFALVFIALEKGIKKNFFLERISLDALEEDEVVAMEFLDKKLRKELGLGFKGLIGEKEKNKLKEMKIKEVPVYRNLPRYGPFIFLGAIIALVFPNAIFLLFL